MGANRIVFVAWEEAKAGSRDKIDQAQAWERTGNNEKSKSSKGEKRKFKAVIYHPERQSEDLKRMEIGQIYILGHGAPGHKSIGDLEAGGTELSAPVVADRLIASGLQPSFMGDIKLFSCHSAIRTKGANSFADRFAEAMWGRTYINCRIYGYTESLNAAYTEGVGKGALLHKYGLSHDGGVLTMKDRANTYRRERTNHDAVHDAAFERTGRG